MKREKEIPATLLAWLAARKSQVNKKVFDTLDIYCTVPVRAVKMRILKEKNDGERFATVIIPAVDVYTTDKAMLKEGYLKRDHLSYFISETRKVFPYGHIYADSGYVCLGSIFVPSAVPERSSTLPLETLFLHNDRNLSHGNSHLTISPEQSDKIHTIMEQNRINLEKRSDRVVSKPGADIIKYDEIWCLSACVAEQKPLPEALRIMSAVYDVVFEKDIIKERLNRGKRKQETKEETANG